MKFVDTRNLFDLNENMEIEVLKDLVIGTYVHVHNIFKYPEKVREYILSCPAPIWKPTSTTRNFIDYVDCRHQQIIAGGAMLDAQNLAIQLILDVYGVEIGNVSSDTMLVTNVFKDLVPKPDNFVGRGRPHRDNAPPVKGFALLTPLNYMPEEGVSSTDYYTPKNEGIDEEGLYETGENYYTDRMSEYWEVIGSLPHEFNRALLFPTEHYHGAVHTGFLETPRINSIIFLEYIN